ncbi:cadherin-23-like [Mytilus trossulus]|uniref:cadherin-23-like n=1 Tax=Mytilus trossulus TaxID=6551 RepID=UPI00300799F6
MDIYLKVLFLFLLFCLISSTSGQCPDNRVIGKNTPKDEDRRVDTEIGLSILGIANDNQYKINCCGFVKEWKFYAKTNTGELRLQVWRPETSPSYSLVGQNIVNVANAELDSTVTKSIANSADWIPVKNGDILGWYTPGFPMVTYDGGQQVRRVTGSVVASSTPYDWGSVPQTTGRDYGLHAVLSPGTSPSITNLATTLTLNYNDDVATNTLVITLTVSDADISDTLTTIMTTSTAYFSFSSTTLELRTAQTLSITTHTMNFRVTDTCGHTDTGTVKVIVTNNPPVIHNMASATATINEALVIETELFAINVTDASAGDFVTCEVTAASTPADANTKFFIKFISGTAQYGIFVKDQPGLDYDTTNLYNLVIECTDTKDEDTKGFTVYITRNQQPSFDNLQNQITVSTTAVSIGTIVFNVSVSDQEDDQLFYSMDCIPAGGSFIIHNSGAVVSNADLTGSTVTGYDCNVYVNDSYTQVGPRILTITIADINHAPVIDNLPIGTPVSVAENEALGASVYQVSVSDQNSLDTHTYTGAFVPGLFANYFVINSNTGLITTSTTNTIDYESFTDKTADITVTVSDGQESDSELIQITVTNVNEAPVFIQNSYSISGNEGLAGSVIGIPSFEVNDPDADALLYSIDCTEFSIGASTGQISLAADYDTDAASISTSTTIQCNVNVSDGVLQDTATLQVTLSNINDNTPIFSKDNYAFYANANDNIGKILTGDVLAATDGDAGVYGTTTFSLDQTGLGKNYFEVSDSGDIYLILSLNPDFFAGTALSFTATVTDSEGLTDTAGIAVIVSEYTTTTPSTTTDRFITFWEDSKNVAWFTFLMLILLALLGLLLFWILTGVNWTKLLAACKRRPKRKWKWNPMVERDPGRRLPPPPPPPKPQYIPPPTPPQIKPSGIKWEYWTDQDFSAGNLG